MSSGVVAAKKLNVLVVAGLAVVLGTVVAGFLWVRVCDEQLTGSGRIVTVCRHLATTDPPVVVLGVLALVLLSMFYVEISGFGITLKRKVADLQETVGDLAEFNRERLLRTDVGTDSDQVPDARIADLAGRYNTLRWTMPSGRERTNMMGDVVRSMRAALRDADDFDIAGHLAHEDRGVRLAAFAYLRDHAAPEVLDALVTATVAEDKPFGQYTALRTIRHQLDAGARLTRQDRDALRDMRSRIGADTDRGQQIGAILGEE